MTFGSCVLRGSRINSSQQRIDLKPIGKIPENDHSEDSNDLGGVADETPSVLRIAHELQESGKTLQALQTFSETQKAFEALESPTLVDEKIWLEATVGAIETATTIDQNQFAIKTLQESLPRFKSSNWKESRKSTGAVYRRMIQLAGNAGHPEHALDIFDSARQHLKLDKKLRRTLVDASVLLDRHESLGTAYLCLNDLIDGETREPEEFEKIIELIRKTIRIDLKHPVQSDLSEHIKLVKKVQSIGDFSWTYAYLATAEIRKGNFKQAATFVDNLNASEQAATETYALAAVVNYELCRYEIATEFLQTILANDGNEALSSDEVSRWNFLLKLCRVVLLLDGKHTGETEKNHPEELKSLIKELLQKLNGSVWELDAQVVIQCAEIICEIEIDELASNWNEKHLLKPWMVPILAEGISQKSDTSLESLAAIDSPHRNQIISKLIRTKSQLSNCEIEQAKLDWQNHSVVNHEDDSIQGQLQDIANFLQFELQQHEAKVNSAKAARLSKQEIAPDAGQLHAWGERLRSQLLIDNGKVQELEKNTSNIANEHEPPRERKRIQLLTQVAVNDRKGWDEKVRTEIHEQVRSLHDVKSPVAIDILHWCLWLVEIKEFDQADSIISKLPKQLDAAIEVKIARATIARTKNAEQGLEDLKQLSDRSDWENSHRLTSFRPWRLKVPQDRWHVEVKVSVHRIADILHVVDLQVESGLLKEAITNLKLAQELSSGEKQHFEDLVGSRFSKIAVLQIPDSPAEACRTYRWGLECNSQNPEFCLNLASAVGDEVEEIIFEVLVDDLAANDATRRESPVGAKVHQLTEITAKSPDLLEQRFSRVKHAVGKIPNWDAVRRSFVWGLYRDHDHESVIAESEHISKKSPSDHTLRGRSFWELNRLTEASQEFEAGDTPGWKGCSSAAASLQRLWVKPVPLDDTEVSKILDQLKPEDCPAELAQRVNLWRGAILLAANRPVEALPLFEEILKANGLKDDELPKVEFLKSLAIMRTGDLSAAEKSLLESHQESSLKELTWPLAEHSKLQGRRWSELPDSDKVLNEHRQLGFETAPAQLSRASLACRLGQIETFHRELNNAIEWRKRQKDALIGPLALFLIDEENFLLARQQLQLKQFEHARTVLESVSANRSWKTQTEIWKIICDSHLNLEVKDQLQVFAQETSPWIADAGAQLAMFSLREKDLTNAEKWASESLSKEKDHPFAVAAQALLAEARSDRVKAKELYLQLAKRDSNVIPRSLLVNVLMALGRLATLNGEQEEAFDWFVKATEVDPKHPEAAKRRAVQLAILANEEEQLNDAEQALVAAQKVAPENVLLALARVNVARSKGQVDAMAARFEEMIAMPDFASIDVKVREQLALHGVEIQFKLQRFGAAAEALARLYQDNPSPEVHERLLNCRLLQAVQEIGLQPLPDNALPNVFKAATAVCAGRTVPATAVLLKSITGVLTQQFNKESTQATIEELKTLDTSSQQGLEEIRLVAGKLLGDKDLTEKFESTISSDLQSATRNGVELLAANFSGDTKPLRTELQRIIESNSEENATVYSLDELLTAVLVSSGPREAEENCEIVISWANRFQGTAETRNLCTAVLAQRAAFLLKKKELRTAMQFLSNANNVFNGKRIANGQLQEESV